MIPSERDEKRKTCGAKTRTGGLCRVAPMPNGRCYRHGGSTPSGPAHGAWKHGRYESALPMRLRERFLASINDPELLDMSRELAVYDARLHELMERVDTGESGALWRALRKAFQALRAATRAADKVEQARLMNVVAGLIESGFADNAAWADVFEVFELRRVTMQSEARRRQALQDTLTTQQAMSLVAALIDSVRRHVSDRSILQAVQGDIMGLLNRESRPGALPAGSA